jgi:hypothetical protein
VTGSAADSAIVLHNSSTDDVQIWFMDGPQIKGRNGVIDESGDPDHVSPPWRIVGASSGTALTAEEASALAAAEASAAIFNFHRETSGILVVGSPVGSIQKVEGGAHLQRFEFGSILKPLDGPPAYANRYLATIDIAAIKCFGTDDPGGTDEPYIVAAVYAIDPLVKEHAVQTNEIHFGSIEEGSIFAPRPSAYASAGPHPRCRQHPDKSVTVGRRSRKPKCAAGQVEGNSHSSHHRRTHVAQSGGRCSSGFSGGSQRNSYGRIARSDCSRE